MKKLDDKVATPVPEPEPHFHWPSYVCKTRLTLDTSGWQPVLPPFYERLVGPWGSRFSVSFFSVSGLLKKGEAAKWLNDLGPRRERLLPRFS